MILLEKAGLGDGRGTRSAWRRFVATGEVDGRLRPHVARAWTRAAASGCDPHHPQISHLSAEATRALLEREAKLREAARPFLAALSLAAGGSRHAAVLADTQARVLTIVADEETAAGPEALPGPGAQMAEGNAGSNGVGTTLAERAYVEVVGAEHYLAGFQKYTCQGVPLVGGGGEDVGVLSMCVRRVETARRVRNVLFCAAQAIECDLLARRLSPEAEDAGARAAVVERLRQDLVQRITTGRLQLEVAARRLSRGGDEGALLEGARRLGDSFRHLAGTWRDLVSDAPSSVEPISLPDLVADLIVLTDTEARVNATDVAWGRVERVRSLADRRHLAQSVLDALLTAMQAAGRGGHIRVDVIGARGDDDAVICVRALSPVTGREVRQQILAPLLG